MSSRSAVVVSRPADAIYGSKFWLAYTANFMLVCGNSMNFRFADFIAALGGNEETSGEIVQAGTIAALLCRFFLGRAIDYYGSRPCWLASGAVYFGGVAAFAFQDRISQVLWLARIAYAAGIAGMFSCSIVYIQNQAPANRRTEIIGSLASSGFIGTIVGAQIGDLIFTWLAPGRPRFLAMFLGAALLGVAHLLIVLWLTRHDAHVRSGEIFGPLRLILLHWPGSILLVAIVQGMPLVVTTVFLTRYAAAMGFRGVGFFFLIYASTAFACRWILRESATLFGRHKMVLWGLAGLAAGQFFFLGVSSEWLFVLPAVATGFGYALLSPAVISIFAGKFDPRHRGSGTALALALPISAWRFPLRFWGNSSILEITAVESAVSIGCSLPPLPPRV